MTLTELKQKIAQDLSDHSELNTFLDERMKRLYPELRPEFFEEDERMESKFYGLRNDLFLSIMNSILGSMNSIDEE